MGWGKALSAVVVMSISVMLLFSLLPVGADKSPVYDIDCVNTCSDNYISALSACISEFSSTEFPDLEKLKKCIDQAEKDFDRAIKMCEAYENDDDDDD